ncbi:hypothetical protein NAEGRDRAFT_52840 [Naegleria gruberi]|uniref:IQ calmodulin-binding motif family protein n=1 Tax=Naegleria gruberi TaxID=5762 RepID=D2VWL4_NAEGR|nr:uncharacterized protein NAEGRDRAFT_52840 [Naegleria gruberi]EFC38912.1 hypothetical protein NAEGRDRAFT_52840 [Naegleria gruberi]|eukprot:XP_002671656.1 hypothetical protein NAEGRDRAFT_52840 [Naegleria gruberi strain NEG-M]
MMMMQDINDQPVVLHEEDFDKPPPQPKQQQNVNKKLVGGYKKLSIEAVDNSSHNEASLNYSDRRLPESPFKGRSPTHNNSVSFQNNNTSIISTLINNDLSDKHVKLIRRTPYHIRHGIRSSKQRRRYFIRNIEFHPLMAFISAAIEIQRCIKGYLTRRGFYIRRINELKALKKVKEDEKFRQYSTLYEVATKALITPIAKKNEENLSTFLNSYMGVIQAKFHQLLTVWRYGNDEYLRNRLAHIASSVIQSRYKLYRRRLYDKTGSKDIFFKKYKMYFYDKKCHAAFIIQKWWRNTINKQIFQFYKQLIIFKERTHPYDILRAINPSESQLIDPSIGAFIRFRLGGKSFPPIVFYKVFLKKPIIDINSFAPRNYSGERKQLDLISTLTSNNLNNNNINLNNNGNIVKTMTFSNHRDVLATNWEFQDWYQREERNSWRPVSTNLLVHEDILDDPVFSNNCFKFILDRAKKEAKHLRKRNPNLHFTSGTTSKVLQVARDDKEVIDSLLPYHYLPWKRKENNQRKKRKKRLEWLIKMKKAELLNKPYPKVMEDEDNVSTTTTGTTTDRGLKSKKGSDSENEEEKSPPVPMVRTVNSDLRALALTIKEKDLLAELEEIELFGDVAVVEDEMDDLLKWCDDLDYYKYVEDWQLLATTLPSDKPRRPKKPTYKIELDSSEFKKELKDIQKKREELAKQEIQSTIPQRLTKTPDSEYTTITTLTSYIPVGDLKY